MANPALTISFSSKDKTRDTSAFVLLEQEKWDPNLNYLTKAQVFGWLANKLFATDKPEANCGTGDGSFFKDVYAYPSLPGLSYQLGVSWGVLGPKQQAEVDYTEAIQCDLQTDLALKYPPISITSYEWVGDVYNENGEIIPRPQVAINGLDLSVAEKVYGTLLVVYRVMQHRYSLAISPRPGALENKLQSFAYAVWNGGNTFMEIEAPDGAEDGACNGDGSGSTKFGDDPYNPGYVPAEDETHNIDYCSGEEIDG